MRSIFAIALLIFLICGTSAQQGPYTWDKAENFLMYAYSAYCDASALTDWSCYWCSSAATPLNINYTFFNASTNTFGYAGYSSTEIVFGFRGTLMTSLENWITDLKYAKTAPYENVPGAEVHEGFYQAYQHIQDGVRAAAKALIAGNPGLPILVTGHSLGAALATLCAVDLAKTFGVEVYSWNFGSPRVGNQVFASYCNKHSKLTYRSVNQRDLVPHLPPEDLGFYHVATEVWYPHNVTYFKICNGSGEDPSCSDSLTLALSVDDHLTYLGYDERDGHGNGC